MSTTGIPRAVTPGQWSGHDWAGGVQTESLSPFDTLLVRTRNSCYELSFLVPATGEVLVRGGRFFPVFTPATLLGSSRRGAQLRVRGIYPGLNLELRRDGQTVRTSRIRTVTLAPRPMLH